MAEIIPKWVQTLIIGILFIVALVALVLFLNKFANPQSARNAVSSILKK